MNESEKQLAEFEDALEVGSKEEKDTVKYIADRINDLFVIYGDLAVLGLRLAQLQQASAGRFD